MSDTLKLEATQALAELAEWHVQSGIDGASNIWILKPGGKSRGRGISCTNSWADIKVWPPPPPCPTSSPGLPTSLAECLSMTAARLHQPKKLHKVSKQPVSEAAVMKRHASKHVQAEVLTAQAYGVACAGPP